MIKILLFVMPAICFATLCIGCSSTYNVLSKDQNADSLHLKDPYYDYQLNQKLLLTKAELFLKNKESFKGTNFSIQGDSLRWFSVVDKIPHVVAITDVDFIIKRNRLLGGIEGFFFGALGGGVTGIFGSGIYEAFGGHAFLGGLIVFVGVSIVGTIGGTTVGIVNGDHDTYRFDHYSIQSNRKKE